MTNRLDDLRDRTEEQYFNANHLTTQESMWVGWIDLMGMRSRLRENQKLPAIMRNELLSCMYEYVASDSIRPFSIGDGVMIVGDNKSEITEAMRAIFFHYSKFNPHRYFNDGWEEYFLRVIRGGIGSGKLHTVDREKYDNETRIDNSFPENLDITPFGPAIISAFDAEFGAPFSIHSEEDEVAETKWWKLEDVSECNRINLAEAMADYFNWFEYQFDVDYDPRETDHPDQFAQYFEIEEKWDELYTPSRW